MFFRPRAICVNPPCVSIHFWFVYLIAVVFNFQALLVGYSAPTFIEQFVQPSTVGILYALGAAGSIMVFLTIPYLLRVWGNVTMSIVLMAASLATLSVFSAGFSPTITIAALLLFLVINPLLYLHIDVFSETLIGKNEAGTGHKRGLALALMSVAALLAPLSISILAGESGNLIPVFWLAQMVGLIFIVIIIAIFRNFYDPAYSVVKVRTLLKTAWTQYDLRIVLSTHFLLQVFFTWTVVFIPLYLVSVVGLSWTAVGTIIAAGLFAYVIFEYPVGILADDYIGEKEMMALGFLVLALTMAGVTAVGAAATWVWMTLMFISRFGASMVEVTTESYFFKKVSGSDAAVISLFRLMRPLGSVLGALLGSAALLVLPFHLAFLVLAATMTIGIFLSLFLHDTR